MIITKTISETRQALLPFRMAGQRIAFVPTMGNLHEGHLELVRQAQKRADRVVVSIFVNPMQFRTGEDFEQYPRTFSEDKEKLESVKADVLFSPQTTEVYPNDLQTHTQVNVPTLSDLYCGKFRPGHFQGVATVVTKLLNIVWPDVVLLGEKDYQQCRVIQKMVTDLCWPMEVVLVPTVREPNGLALSSRNQYLSAEERVRAQGIYKVLQLIQQSIRKGQKDFASLEEQGRQTLEEIGLKPQYLHICRQQDLQPATPADQQLVVLVAAFMGKTRLIDNISINLP